MKKLKLNKEIIANLQKEEMNSLKGGGSDRLCASNFSCGPACPIQSGDCQPPPVSGAMICKTY